LNGPGGDEHGRGAGEPTDEAGCREHRQARDEDPPQAVEVGEPPAEQEEPGEGEAVAVDHPLHARRVEAQCSLDRGQRDVHHRHVEHHHELRRAGQEHHRY
jgi:hypothetical protein